MGAEPTFTDRFSEQPAWLNHAVGADKEARAHKLLAGLCQPGMAVLRTAGRQYPGESQPRWSVGLYGRRDSRPVWVGPPDPMLTPDLAPPGPAAMRDFGRRLNHGLRDLEHDLSFLVGGKSGLRMVDRSDDRSPWVDSEPQPEPGPESVHDRAIPPGGRCEEPAADGDLLLAISVRQLEPGGPLLAVVELPAIGNVSAFLTLLDVIGRAARAANLPGLVFQGSPPPEGPTVAWTTLTPDPAVVEVNGAPAQDASHFYGWVQRVYAVAESVRLWPYRLQYNGIVSDSGGGGHLTLGGPTPRESPFFLTPTLLPRLLRYLNRHPSLSYWFATTSIGISGQSPRPDEGPGQMFDELEVALDLLDRLPDGDAETIARSLAPFLVDASGNPHRAELNLEKLWNPRLPVRGCLGLVEFRAFGMARSPEAAAARACLLRASTAMLTEDDKAPRLHHWGDTLHDRFALPFYLQQDLREVLADLHSAGLALGEPIAEQLLHNPDRLLGAVELDGCRLEIERALEFWPLVGDIASQEAGGSRLVDSSTTRLQVTLRPLPAREPNWTTGG